MFWNEVKTGVIILFWLFFKIRLNCISVGSYRHTHWIDNVSDKSIILKLPKYALKSIEKKW